MFNNWLSIGGFTLHGYGFMIAVGILTAYKVAEKQAERYYPQWKDCVLDVILLSAVCGFAGAKLLYVIVEWKAFLQDPASVLGSGGFVFYGGVIAGVLAAWIYCQKKGIRFSDLFSLAAPEIALAQAFGRIGCFCAGCCYGRQTDLFFGVVFPEGSLAPALVPLIPTQLISSAFDFVLFGVLYHYYRHSGHPEKTGAWYLIAYSIGRFLLEFLRGDVRGSVGVLSTSQFISLLVLAAGLFLLFRPAEKQDMIQ